MDQSDPRPLDAAEMFEIGAATTRELPALRELARRALIAPGDLTSTEIQELGFAFIVATRPDTEHRGEQGAADKGRMASGDPAAPALVRSQTR